MHCEPRCMQCAIARHQALCDTCGVQRMWRCVACTRFKARRLVQCALRAARYAVHAMHCASCGTQHRARTTHYGTHASHDTRCLLCRVPGAMHCIPGPRTRITVMTHYAVAPSGPMHSAVCRVRREIATVHRAPRATRYKRCKVHRMPCSVSGPVGVVQYAVRTRRPWL